MRCAVRLKRSCLADGRSILPRFEVRFILMVYYGNIIYDIMKNFIVNRGCSKNDLLYCRLALWSREYH